MVFYKEFLLLSLEVLSLIFTACLKTQLSKGTKKLLDGRKRPENRRKKRSRKRLPNQKMEIRTVGPA